MQDNDLLKPYLEYPKYTGRYLVFAFDYNCRGGGQQDIIGCFDTLDEISGLFVIKYLSDTKCRLVNPNTPDDSGYQYLEVLDLDEKQFIDINVLDFPTME